MRVVREFGGGVALYWAGFRMWKTKTGLMALGLVPGFLTALLFAALFVAVFVASDDAGRWFAQRVAGEAWWAELLAFATTLAILGGALLATIYAFVTVTSIVGQPFFEALSHSIDDSMGAVPPGPNWPWWRNAARGVGEAIRLGFLTLPLSMGLALMGLLPGIGTITAWIAGALLGGWFVALEFTAVPFERRGLRLRDRRRLLAKRRAYTLGFGAMAYVMSAFAPLAVVMMPSAVAGGTLLAREALDGAAGALALSSDTVPQTS